MSWFEFNGERSTDYGLTINSIPEHGTAEQRVETYEVPGRNGCLVRDTGAYSTVSQKYDVWYTPRGESPGAAFHAIARWLSPAGFQILRDSYDPDCFRMARRIGGLSLENWMHRKGRVSIEFECQPERWLDEGQLTQEPSSGDDLYNHWMTAYPVITLTGDGTITIGDYSVTIATSPGEIILDCENQNAYNGSGNQNSHVTLSNGFPKLVPGQNTVTYSGFTAVKIIPRWWTL